MIQRSEGVLPRVGPAGDRAGHGVGRFLPTGEGLFSFRTQDEALEAIAAVRRDHSRRARAGRARAEEHFDSDRVLTSILERL